MLPYRARAIAFEQAPSTPREERVVAVGFELPDLSGPGLVDGLVHLGDDVIAVEDMDRSLGATAKTSR